MISGWTPSGVSGAQAGRAVAFASTRALTRSGYVAANSAAIIDPFVRAHDDRAPEAAASMTVRTSPIHSSSSGSRSSATGSESPIPRLSNEISRLNDGQAAEVVREAGEVPARLDVAEPRRDEHEIGRALADDLVCDVNVTRFRIPRLWDRHAGKDARFGRTLRKPWTPRRRRAPVSD